MRAFSDIPARMFSFWKKKPLPADAAASIEAGAPPAAEVDGAAQDIPFEAAPDARDQDDGASPDRQ